MVDKDNHFSLDFKTLKYDFSDNYQSEFMYKTRIFETYFKRISVKDLLGGKTIDLKLNGKIKGAFLLDRWAKWNKENRAGLGKIKESAPSLVSLVSGLTTH